MSLSPADQAFYEWYHEQSRPQSAASLDTQRTVFLAGWNARAERDGYDTRAEQED